MEVGWCVYEHLKVACHGDMIPAMKIYTRGGDDGTTGLVGGGRIKKDDLRLECLGEVDETNASIGLAAAAADETMLAALRIVQNELFIIGSHLATTDLEMAEMALPPLPAAAITRLEEQIDAAQEVLSPLAAFILPGGCEVAARLHLARTTCRRAERWVVRLAAQTSILPAIGIYLNRLSDWLFVQARLANHLAGVADVPWQK